MNEYSPTGFACSACDRPQAKLYRANPDAHSQLCPCVVIAGFSRVRRESRTLARRAADSYGGHRGRRAAISFLETLVNINSGTMNVAGVEQVGQIMSAELQELGFATRWHSMSAVGRAGHVIAEHHGSGHGKRILLVGHLDTVFEKDSPFQRYQRRGDTAEGPGVCDMKGGLAVMVGALRALQVRRSLAECERDASSWTATRRMPAPRSPYRAPI